MGTSYGSGAGTVPIMVLTRQQKEDAFNYILDDVLETDDTSPLKQALKKASYSDIEALMMFDEANDYDHLVYDKSPTVLTN